MTIINNDNKQDDNQIDIELQIILEEYKALKAEIQRRSQDQLVCVRISLTSIGILSGLATSSTIQFDNLLLIAPWIFLTLGILWCDHHTIIHDIGFYLQKLELRIKTLKSSRISEFIKSEDWGWETFLSKKINNRTEIIFGRLTLLKNLLPIFYFFIPSVVSFLIYGIYWSIAKNFSPLRILLIISIFLLYCFLTLIFFLSWKQAGIATNSLRSFWYGKRTSYLLPVFSTFDPFDKQ